MVTDPALSTAPEPVPLGGLSEPILVDPGARLLGDVVRAYREVAPALVEPCLASGNGRDGGDDSGDGGGSDGPTAADELPTLRVFAGESAIETATAGFRAASRLAALLDADVVDLRVLDAPQPNAALAGTDTGYALLRGRNGDGRWLRVGDDATLRGRYASEFADADRYRLRTPSRRRVYEGFATRCDESVAAAVLRALDLPAAPEDAGDSAGAADSTEYGDAKSPPAGPDPEQTRIRAYAVGAREGVLDRTLRRACEDAGLGSPSTFTRIKRLLREADLIETTPEPQTVGRPRERLVARGALAAAETPAETVAAVEGVAD
ncbi:DUF5821 family protein [Halorubrum sp. RMP-47]|uniref:DUF5821 family protein n=1 Tax=Halorubrum miltondacostae TaxID=3076378 RepID=A0ABD5M669_9EURY